VLIGDPKLCTLYAEAIAVCGGEARIAKGEAAAVGLGRIAGAVRWS
jgi:hypothetical protein